MRRLLCSSSGDSIDGEGETCVNVRVCVGCGELQRGATQVRGGEMERYWRRRCCKCQQIEYTVAFTRGTNITLHTVICRYT